MRALAHPARGLRAPLDEVLSTIPRSASHLSLPMGLDLSSRDGDFSDLDAPGQRPLGRCSRFARSGSFIPLVSCITDATKRRPRLQQIGGRSTRPSHSTCGTKGRSPKPASGQPVGSVMGPGSNCWLGQYQRWLSLHRAGASHKTVHRQIGTATTRRDYNISTYRAPQALAQGREAGQALAGQGSKPWALNESGRTDQTVETST